MRPVRWPRQNARRGCKGLQDGVAMLRPGIGRVVAACLLATLARRARGSSASRCRNPSSPMPRFRASPMPASGATRCRRTSSRSCRRTCRAWRAWRRDRRWRWAGRSSSTWPCRGAPRMARSARGCWSAGRSAETARRFEVVTGVSAGALIAPYAFLGPSYDRQLAELWTNFDAEMVATPAGAGRPARRRGDRGYRAAARSHRQARRPQDAPPDRPASIAAAGC